MGSLTVLDAIAALGAIDRHSRRLVVWADGVPWYVTGIALNALTGEVELTTRRAYNDESATRDPAPCCAEPT